MGGPVKLSELHRHIITLYSLHNFQHYSEEKTETLHVKSNRRIPGRIQAKDKWQLIRFHSETKATEMLGIEH